MPYTYNPQTGGYDYDPNGTIPDTGGADNTPVGMNPQNPFGWDYGSDGSNWSGWGGAGSAGQAQWPGGTYGGQVAGMPPADTPPGVTTSDMGMNQVKGFDNGIWSNQPADIYTNGVQIDPFVSSHNWQIGQGDAATAPGVGVMPGMNHTDPRTLLDPAIKAQQQAELDKSMLTPDLPAKPQNYSNLYGGFGQGWQQGFNELNNKQFTTGSDSFNQAFGSTGGTGVGNNFNWNIYPGLVSPILDDNFKQAAIKVAAANPQYDFEPTMIDGKWVLGSRARDTASQVALLKPVLPTTPTGARTSSGSGYGVGVVKGKGDILAPNLPVVQKGGPLGASLGIGSQNPNAAIDYNTGAYARIGDAIKATTSGPVNQPYVPYGSGPGGTYVPMTPQLPPSTNGAFPGGFPSVASRPDTNTVGIGGGKEVVGPAPLPPAPIPSTLSYNSEPMDGAVSYDGTMRYSRASHQWFPIGNVSSR